LASAVHSFAGFAGRREGRIGAVVVRRGAAVRPHQFLREDGALIATFARLGAAPPRGSRVFARSAPADGACGTLMAGYDGEIPRDRNAQRAIGAEAK
jgi:hypothetical protein